MGIAGELPGESLVRGSGGGLVFIKVLSRSFESPWAVARQAPWSMGFSRREYWSGLPFPLQGIFPTQGWNPGLLRCRQILPAGPPGKRKELVCLLCVLGVGEVAAWCP